MTPALVVAVTASSGGLGASTLAVAVGAQLARRGCRVVVVDTDAWGGGLDVVAGLEDEPGLRWEDLVEVEGEVDGPALVAGLPQAHGTAILSFAGPRRSSGPARGDGLDRFWRVFEGLRSACDIVLVDASRSGLIGPRALLISDVVVLLTGSGVRALGAASLVIDHLQGADGPLWVCVRTPRHIAELEEVVADIVGVPVLGVLADDGHVHAAAERGCLPGRSRGRLAALAARLADELWPDGPASAVASAPGSASGLAAESGLEPQPLMSGERLEWATVAVPDPATTRVGSRRPGARSDGATRRRRPA